MSSSGASGRYRIRRLIARGGMAEVFEAQAVSDGGVARRVAIKRLLSGDDADESVGRMFLDEARIASQLHHASIVALLDYGVHEGRPFQVLEHVDGLDSYELRKRATRAGEGMPTELALHIVHEIAHALEYAHHALADNGEPLGVVHRDVKPSNILVSWSGDVKLGDFGIAFARDRSEKTSDGAAKGTPSYMSPEQIRGEQVDARTDVFALGCVLSALVIGQSPVRLPDNLRRLAAGEEMDLDPDLDPDIARIVARATRWHATERYPSAAAMAEAVGELLARRIDRAPRALLLRWLARMRAVEPPARAPARLDQLLDLDLVLAPSASRSRDFVTVAAPTRREPASPVVPVPAKARGGGAALSAAVALAALATAVVVWRVAYVRTQARTPDERRTAAVATTGTTATPPADVPMIARLDATSAPAPVDSAPALRTDRSLRVTPGPLPPSVQGSAAPRGTVAAPEVADPSGTGMLVVRGPGSVGAQIRVDGAPRGLAPKLIELPVGPHTVSLDAPTGEALGSRRVVITQSHTRSAPAAWDVAAR